MILFGSCGPWLSRPTSGKVEFNRLAARARAIELSAAATATARRCGFSRIIFSEDIAEAPFGARAIDRRVLNTAAIYFSIYVRGHLIPRDSMRALAQEMGIYYLSAA